MHETAGFFKRIDDGSTPFLRQLIIDLRDACWERKEEILKLRAMNSRLEDELAEQRNKVQMDMQPNGDGNHQLGVQNRDGGVLILWVFSVCFAMYVGMIMSGYCVLSNLN